MGLIAFPFILCLLTSPFVIGGVLLYMWHEDRKARGIRGLGSSDYKRASVCAMKEGLEWQKKNGGKSLAFGEGQASVRQDKEEGRQGVRREALAPRRCF